MRIAIIGAEINDSNLGCQALTWSLIQLLDDIGKQINQNIEYSVIESSPTNKTKENMCKKLHIKEESINSIKRGNVVDFLRIIKHIPYTLNCIIHIKSSDLVIDVTEGDSFSDLYGSNVFNTFSRYVIFAIWLKKKVILAPQTYGPFFQKKNIKTAKYIFNHASYIFARDRISGEFVRDNCKKRVIVTTDLAFGLNYERNEEIRDNGKINIGLNISGLLATEKKNKYNQNLNTHDKYNKIIDFILNYLVVENDKYCVHLIPHTMDDIEFIELYHNKYIRTKSYDLFKDPVDAKSLIAAMDLFIGSRMHATIAALSSGIATIPIAYSRKFEGVFELVGYNHTININDSDADSINCIIKEKIDSLKLLQKDAFRIKSKVLEHEKILVSEMKKAILY